MFSKRPHAFVFAAPSGGGKSTLIASLMEQRSDLEFSISCTTRPPRRDEVDGVSYYFVSDEEFTRRVESGEFVEWELVHGNRYGTLRSEIARILAAGHYPVFDLDVKGAINIRKQLELPHLIFITLPDEDTYRNRLLARGTETTQQIEMRLSRMQSELALAENFQHTIVNDDLVTATRELADLVQEIIEHKIDEA